MLSVRVPSCTQKVAPKLGARNAGHEHTRAAEPGNTENMPCNQQLSPCSIKSDHLSEHEQPQNMHNSEGTYGAKKRQANYALQVS